MVIYVGCAPQLFIYVPSHLFKAPYLTKIPYKSQQIVGEARILSIDQYYAQHEFSLFKTRWGQV